MIQTVSGEGAKISPFLYEARNYESARENIPLDGIAKANADITAARPSFSRCPLPTSMIGKVILVSIFQE